MQQLVIGAVGAAALLALVMVATTWLRPKSPPPVVPWQPDTRTDEERYEPYGAQLLREMGESTAEPEQRRHR